MKVFNALNGNELKTIVLAEVAQLLDLDTRFDHDAALTSATAIFTLRVDSYPAGADTFNVQVSQIFKGPSLSPVSLRAQIKDAIARALDVDLRFGLNVTYPKLTFDHRLSVELKSLAGVARETVVAAQPVQSAGPIHIDTRVEPHRPSQADDLERSIEVAALEARLHVLKGLPETSHQHAQVTEAGRLEAVAQTETGLRIERGWAPSPGPELAGSWGEGASVGTLQPKETIERVELGVSHPPLVEGGLGAPDAVRREHGLQVPQTQRIGGHVVDIAGF